MRGGEGSGAKGVRAEWQSSEAAAQQQRSAERETGERDELPFLPSPLTLIPVRPTAREMAKQGKAHVC